MLAPAKHCFHERKEKNHVKQLREAIDTRCGIGGYFDSVFIRGSRRRHKDKYQPAVASNFYGVPPLNSAITDLINAFEAANPNYTVTVVDHGATATLARNIIEGNTRGVDLFLAADTETPLDLLTNHFSLVTPYNSLLPAALHL